jgi:acetyl-CoA carboxylase carboxyltransferase component
MRNTPADGMVTGIGTVNAAHFGPSAAAPRCDGLRLHRAGRHPGHAQPPEDRPSAGRALQWRLPVVLFAEGGGGRPGDVDMPIVAGLHVATFSQFARLNGRRCRWWAWWHGRCFAGNAACWAAAT